MPARQSLSLLVLTLLMTFPAGIAFAGNQVDIQGTNSRVRVTDDGDVKINSNTDSVSPVIVPSSRLRNRILLRSLRSSQYSQCNGRSYVHQSNHTSGYGSSVSHTYNSTTTTSCQ
jgi:hypothetical protein